MSIRKIKLFYNILRIQVSKLDCESTLKYLFIWSGKFQFPNEKSMTSFIQVEELMYFKILNFYPLLVLNFHVIFVILGIWILFP